MIDMKTFCKAKWCGNTYKLEYAKSLLINLREIVKLIAVTLAVELRTPK